jgi:hypothetical protein
VPVFYGLLCTVIYILERDPDPDRKIQIRTLISESTEEGLPSASTKPAIPEYSTEKILKI